MKKLAVAAIAEQSGATRGVEAEADGEPSVVAAEPQRRAGDRPVREPGNADGHAFGGNAGRLFDLAVDVYQPLYAFRLGGRGTQSQQSSRANVFHRTAPAR